LQGISGDTRCPVDIKPQFRILMDVASDGDDVIEMTAALFKNLVFHIFNLPSGEQRGFRL
jgi:hypothetical protein